MASKTKTKKAPPNTFDKLEVLLEYLTLPAIAEFDGELGVDLQELRALIVERQEHTGPLSPLGEGHDILQKIAQTHAKSIRSIYAELNPRFRSLAKRGEAGWTVLGKDFPSAMKKLGSVVS